MKNTKLMFLTGAAIVIFLLTGTAWADGQWGRDRRGDGGRGYHQEYQRHNGRGDFKPMPHHAARHFREKRHPLPRNHRHNVERHGPVHAHPDHRHYHCREHRHGHSGGHAVFLSLFDPYFAFGFSAGGR